MDTPAGNPSSVMPALSFPICPRILPIRQSSMLRRWNDYHALHSFRGRSFSLQKPARTVRVLALGGSSTWGYRIPAESGGDYPAQLERRLNTPNGNHASRASVQVINGAFVGATGTRLYHLLRDSLADFSPDIVTLSLTFNDSSSCTLGDEDGYYDMISAPGYERSWWQDWKLSRDYARAQTTLKTLVTEVRGKDPRSTTELWSALGMTTSPPERFAAILRRFAELARERHFQLVLIKEPVVGPQRLIWKDEFYAAIDQVAAEYQLPVVDPAAALADAGGDSLFMDTVHPTREGNKVIADELEKALRPLLARCRRR